MGSLKLKSSDTLKYCAIYILTVVVHFVSGRGRMLEPPMRSSLWRVYPWSANPNIEKNTDDGGLNCGGFWRLHGINKGKCGMCGDPYDAVQKQNEFGGKYYKGIVVRRYYHGDGYINVTIDVQSNIKGYFEFNACPLANANDTITQKCLDKHPLTIKGHGKRYVPDSDRKHYLKLKIPIDLFCKHCVLRWKWVGGNNWGECSDGYGGLGCGDQEEYYNCADISVLSAYNRPRRKRIKTRTTRATTTAATTSVKTTPGTTKVAVPKATPKPLIAQPLPTNPNYREIIREIVNKSIERAESVSDNIGYSNFMVNAGGAFQPNIDSSKGYIEVKNIQENYHMNGAMNKPANFHWTDAVNNPKPPPIDTGVKMGGKLNGVDEKIILAERERARKNMLRTELQVYVVPTDSPGIEMKENSVQVDNTANLMPSESAIMKIDLTDAAVRNDADTNKIPVNIFPGQETDGSDRYNVIPALPTNTINTRNNIIPPISPVASNIRNNIIPPVPPDTNFGNIAPQIPLAATNGRTVIEPSVPTAAISIKNPWKFPQQDKRLSVVTVPKNADTVRLDNTPIATTLPPVLQPNVPIIDPVGGVDQTGVGYLQDPNRMADIGMNQRIGDTPTGFKEKATERPPNWSYLDSYVTTPGTKSDWSTQNTWMPLMALAIADVVMPPQTVVKKDQAVNAMNARHFDVTDSRHSGRAISNITGIDNSRRLRGVAHFDELIDPDALTPPPSRVQSSEKPVAVTPMKRIMMPTQAPMQNENMVTTKRYRNKNIYRVFTTTDLPVPSLQRTNQVARPMPKLSPPGFAPPIFDTSRIAAPPRYTTRRIVTPSPRVTFQTTPQSPQNNLVIKDFVLDTSDMRSAIQETKKQARNQVPYYDLPPRSSINSFPRDISVVSSDKSSSSLSQMHVVAV